MGFGFRLILVALGLVGQASSAPPAPGALESLTATEKGQLEREPNVDNRIRVYEAANLRFQKQVEGEFQNDEFDRIPPQLGAWTEMLETSRKDVEANANRKKKSRAVIRYEIQLRKTISEVKNLALKATADHQKYLEDWLNSAERVRKSLVDVLFQR